MYSFRFSVLTTIIVCAFLASLFPLASIAVAADNITISAEYGPPDTANTWQKFTIPLTADAFDTDASTFNQVMSSVTQFRIRTEMRDGNDVGALDDVSAGNRYSSNFNSSLEGWSAAGDGTMEWVPTGGTSGGYLQISDWASGDWHWAVAPANWSGNWSNLIGSSIVFYMKTDYPSYSAVVEIKSDDSQWLTLSADPMLVPPGGTSIVTVTPNPVSAQQLSVSLNSSDTGCITVPSSMTIGAGQLSGQFVATAAPGADTGCKSVIKVSASGYTDSLITLNVGEVPDSSSNGDIGLSCSDGDNEEGGCCCFHGEHTYMFDPVCVSSVTVKFDTGRGLGCQSNVRFQVYDGSLWSDVGQYQAVSSSGGSELYVIETEVQVGQTISGFKISDGCTCCIDSSSIVLHTASAGDGNDCDSSGTTGSGDSGVTTGSPEADCIVQIGDMDNLGFGWPTGFDVFSGNSTPSHGYPWEIDTADPAGTDRIMLGTGYAGVGGEGYTRSSSRPENLPQTISTTFDCPGVSIKTAIIQMFVDDFQAPVFGSHFQVEMNGVRAPFLESVINALSQTGPIGKLISVQIPSDYLSLLSSGNLSIYIDDPTTGVGDGYAIDFVRLLINPDLTASSYTGMINGKVTDKSTGQPLQGVTVSAGGTADTQTNSNGEYTLSRVPAGLVVVSASLPGYIIGSTTVDLVAGGNSTANISLDPLPASTGDTDNDGVPDNQDQCPNTPAGDTVGSNGCTSSGVVGGPDSDGDGIPDSQDQCPNTPANTSVGGDGCPSAVASANLVVESRTVTPGNQVTVPIKLQNVSDVASLNFNISYNASLVKVIRVDKGSLLSGIAFVANTNESGIIRFGFATENGVDGTGSIGHIVFEAIGSPGNSSPLTVSGIEATNSSGNSISLSTRNGTVTISGNRIPGDYNGDGLVTELDALAALRMSVKLLAEDLILDMDQNGRVTAEDARRILSIAVRGS